MANELQISVQGESLSIYAIIRKHSNQQVWSVADTAFATWANGDIDDYDIALSGSGGDLYTGDFPSDIPAGTRVIVFYYRRAGATPAITDTLLATRDQTWNGTSVASGSDVTLASGALTTMNGAKRQLRLSTSSTTYDTILTELINAVSERIKRITGRDFTATDYFEWYSGNLESVITLNQYPVLNINRVASSRANALTVSYSGSAITAHVQVQTSGIRLRSVVAAGTATTTTLTFADYPTVSTMATAISAVSGWTATVQQDTLAKYLHQTGGISVKSRDHTFTFADEDESEYRVDYSTGQVGFTTSPNYWNDYRYGGDPFGGGRVHTTYNVPAGFRNVLVEYRAGYETIPADIDQVARELVAEAYNYGLTNGNLQSESIGSYSYSLADQVSLSDSQMRRLAPYMRLAVA